jgi:hypothetical protein
MIQVVDTRLGDAIPMHEKGLVPSRRNNLYLNSTKLQRHRFSDPNFSKTEGWSQKDNGVQNDKSIIPIDHPQNTEGLLLLQ